MLKENKYKEFRNYMVNELGITRQDIEAWTKQSVAFEIEKILGQIDFEGIVTNTIKEKVKQEVEGTNSWNRDARKLREAIAKEVVDKFHLEIVFDKTKNT